MGTTLMLLSTLRNCDTYTQEEFPRSGWQCCMQ